MLCFFVDRSVCRNRKYRPLFARWLRRRFLNHRWTGDHGQACRRVRNAASSPTLNSPVIRRLEVAGGIFQHFVLSFFSLFFLTYPMCLC